jgi:hypothetical protein
MCMSLYCSHVSKKAQLYPSNYLFMIKDFYIVSLKSEQEKLEVKQVIIWFLLRKIFKEKKKEAKVESQGSPVI